MKTCSKLASFAQAFNAEGDVRICGWFKHPETIIGNLVKNEFPEIMHSTQAMKIRNMVANGDFSMCCNTCPFLAEDGRLQMVDYNDKLDYPEELSISFEQYCNYKCTCCESNFQHDACNELAKIKERYDIIESRIRDALPYVKHLGGHGTAELFCSPRTLKLLSEWNPKAPKEECDVFLETNGSLFNEKNWGKIENLGDYHLGVCITVMSFNEIVYQNLSGTSMPVSNLEECLKFVRSLRDKGIINYLELATVVQEANYLELPEMTKRFLDEFGADCVRLRPIFPGGIYDRNIQWFFDVRNPNHPYYSMYKKVMENKIFEDERVFKWRGDLDSPLGPHPVYTTDWHVNSWKGFTWKHLRNILPMGISRKIEMSYGQVDKNGVRHKF